MATTKTVDQSIPTTDQRPIDLASLREQKKQLDALIKAAKAAEPQRDRLAAEIARQLQHPNQSLPYCLRSMLQRRVAAGQDREAATTDILAQCRELLDAVDVSAKAH